MLSVNRGKRAIALDLADEHDLRTARALALGAYVLVENFRLKPTAGTVSG